MCNKKHAIHLIFTYILRYNLCFASFNSHSPKYYGENSCFFSENELVYFDVTLSQFANSWQYKHMPICKTFIVIAILKTWCSDRFLFASCILGNLQQSSATDGHDCNTGSSYINCVVPCDFLTLHQNSMCRHIRNIWCPYTPLEVEMWGAM